MLQASTSAPTLFPTTMHVPSQPHPHTSRGYPAQELTVTSYAQWVQTLQNLQAQFGYIPTGLAYVTQVQPMTGGQPPTFSAEL